MGTGRERFHRGKVSGRLPIGHAPVQRQARLPFRVGLIEK
jgi:hypothetical protein